MPIVHQKIENDRQLNRVFKSISSSLAKMRAQLDTITEQKMTKHKAWFDAEVLLISTYLEAHASTDNQERLAKLQGEFDKLWQHFHPVVEQQNPRLQAWIEKRTAEIQAEHDKWDAHVARRRAGNNGANLLEDDACDNPLEDDVLGQVLDTEIQKFADALDELQQKVPALRQLSKTMVDVLGEFMLSNRDHQAYRKLSVATALFTEQVKSLKDPVLLRVWHGFVTAFKALLHFVDVVQSKLTKKMIDQPGRPHFFSTPTLPVADAKDAWVKARDDAFECFQATVQNDNDSTPSV